MLTWVEVPTITRRLRGILYVEFAWANFSLAPNLCQSLIINKDLLWVGSHAFNFWLNVSGTNVAEVLEVAGGLPHITFARPVSHDITTLQPHLSVRCCLHSDILLRHKKVWLAVDTTLCYHCSAVADLRDGAAKALVRC